MVLHPIQIGHLTDEEWGAFRLALMKEGMSMSEFMCGIVKATLSQTAELVLIAKKHTA